MYTLDSGKFRPVVRGFKVGWPDFYFGESMLSGTVLPDSLKEAAEPIVRDLNDGSITENEAKKQLGSL